MRLVFLGTGGPGTPLLGADRRTAGLANRGSNALVVQPDYPAPPTLLIDAGPEIRAQWAAWKDAPRQPDAVLLSHGHHDHIGGMAQFRLCETSVSVYGTANTLAELTRFGEVAAPHDPTLNLVPYVLPEQGEASIAGITVETLPIRHGDTPCTAFVIRHGRLIVAHLTDTSPLIEDHVRAVVAGCDVLIANTPFLHNTLLPDTHPSLADAHERHLSISQAIMLAQEVGAKRLVLLHFMHPVTERELREVAAGNPWVTIPEDGQTLDV